MNILFFLTPKADVSYVYEDFTLRQALEKSDRHRYTSIPILNREGGFVGILTEGDLLRAIRSLPPESDIEKIRLCDIVHSQNNQTVGINDQMENLYRIAINQNFVPVINDDNIFIGIVTRKAIMQYFFEKYADFKIEE